MGYVEDATQKDVGKKDGDSAAAAGSDDDATKTDDGTSSDDEGHEDETGATKLEGNEAQSFVEEILDDYGLESPEELKDWLKDYRSLKGKIEDQDLDQIIANHETLQKYQKHWAKQESEKKKEGETPEETIKRLEKEKDELQKTQQKESDKRKQAKAAERAYEGFCETVESVIKSDRAIPKEYRPFMSEFLGVENPVNEVNIEDRAAVRKIAKEGIKKLQAFEQAVIKRYRDGKIEIPKVASSTSSQTDTASEKASEPKTLKDARRIVHASVQALLGKK